MTGSRRIVLHVGAPKTGTTFLQGALWDQRSALLEQGYVCPGTRERDMFHAAVEIRESFAFWGLDPAELKGSWRRMCAEARDFNGSTIMSHELLSAANPRQIARALAPLEGEEVHVVLTVRDLARQVTSEWQERVKNGGSKSFKSFHRAIGRQLRDQEFSGAFWRSQDPVSILSRWGAQIPAERIHVVTCPPPGVGPAELWHRFADACGFDADALGPLEETTSNKTLGSVQAALLMRINEALGGRIPQPDYGRLVKHQFAQRTLAYHDSPPLQCPSSLVEQLRSWAEERNAVLRKRGYVIHGDLDELLPAPVSADDGDSLGPRAERDAAVEVIADLLVERAEMIAARSAAASLAERALGARTRRVLRRWVRRRGEAAPNGAP